MSIHITTDLNSGNTIIPNSFITKYMSAADGNFVKLYLYLSMASQNQEAASALSVRSLADHLECTESDVQRGLHYWQRESLLSLEETDGTITGITLLANSNKDQTRASQQPVHETSAPSAAATPVSAELAASSTMNVGIPDKQTYTPLQAEALMKDSEIDEAISGVERLLGEPVSQSHLQTILYFMCDVGFSSELVKTLYATAVKKGKKNPNYIEAIGISWAAQGIHTPEEAKAESENFGGRYSLVARAFGIHGMLKPVQCDIVDSWDEYHFDDTIIEEACRRTVLQTGDANFQYASKILSNWHNKQISTLQDIERSDESYKQKKKNSTTKKTGSASKNQFQNFPQRSYSESDYSNLERQLLQGQNS